MINNDTSTSYNGDGLETIISFKAFVSNTLNIDTSKAKAKSVTIKYKHPIVNENFKVTFKISKGMANKEFTKDIRTTSFIKMKILLF